VDDYNYYEPTDTFTGDLHERAMTSKRIVAEVKAQERKDQAEYRQAMLALPKIAGALETIAEILGELRF